MTSSNVIDSNSPLEPRIASFAVLDLETTNLPDYNFNKVAITELSLYGFSVKELDWNKDGVNIIPPRPRVLHKLTLLFNPQMRVHPVSEEITGLDNYMLEYESSFDENAAKTVLGFLDHLQQPVCLIAHNGWNFDFPILKKSLDKLNATLPSRLLCIDSLQVFKEIDDNREIVETLNNDQLDSMTLAEKAFTENSNINWQLVNETTPKRLSSILSSSNDCKRQKLELPRDAQPPRTFKSRRCLFADNTTSTPTNSVQKKFPPKGTYKLSNIYERIFKERPLDAHHAEGDVVSLMKLILHYGNDFKLYAEKFAIPFIEVQKVGVRSNYFRT